MKTRDARKTPQKVVPVRCLFENPMNQERWVCENIHNIKTIDGVEFLYVHVPEQQREVWMRKEALKLVKRMK